MDVVLQATQLAQIDLSATRNEYLFPIPKCLGGSWLMQALNDPARDAPAAHLMANCMVTALPCACGLFISQCNSHWIGAAYLIVNYVLYLQRFMLTIHMSEHRKLFKPEHRALNMVIPYLLSSLYGVPCGLYRPHHVIMHHVEDNQQALDISSTEPYQRDNFLHFLVYWCRYWVGAWFELPAYSLKKKRLRLLGTTLSSEAVYWVVVAALWQVNRVATLWTLLIPFLLSSFLLMFGNWSQHIFVDPDMPRSAFRHTYNCLATSDNTRTYNDGYHIVHHRNSKMHYLEMPQHFINTLDQHDDNDALVFKYVGVFDVGLNVFLGRLDYLAKFIVPCGPKQAARTHQEWVALMKHRLQPVRAKKA